LTFLIIADFGEALISEISGNIPGTKASLKEYPGIPGRLANQISTWTKVFV